MCFMGRLVIAAVIVMSALAYGCGDEDGVTCPLNTLARAPGVCQVPLPPEAGKVARMEAGSYARPGGVTPPAGGRGGAGGQGGFGGARAGSGGGGIGGSGGKPVVPVAGRPSDPEPVVIVPRGGSGGSDDWADAGSGGTAPPMPPAPRCGDDIRQAGETCDGDCPADCDDGDLCTEDVYSGKPDTCDVRCKHSILPTGASCGYNGRTCHAGICYSDSEIGNCGNGTVEPGETCDPKSSERPCLTECEPAAVCRTVMLIGHAAACSARCLQGLVRAGNVCDGGRCDGAGNCVKELEAKL